MPVTGGCLCQAVRYTISAEPIVTRVCWCRLCQYLGAGSAAVNACFPSAALTVRGSLTDYRSTADSGNIMHRTFCPTCGTRCFPPQSPGPIWCSCVSERWMTRRR